MLKGLLISLILVCSLLLASCWRMEPEKPAAPAINNNSIASAPEGAADAGGKPKESEGVSTAAACYNVDTKPKVVLKSQTFPVDFEPFRNSCFVTSHDAEYTTPPLNSEIAIFRDGQNVFEFDGQFNGVTVGCWVAAVAFQDVNGDKTTDIVVVGRCSGKSDSYNENTVYLNDGKTCVTNADANYRLADLNSLGEITSYIKKNPSYFSLTEDAANSNR